MDGPACDTPRVASSCTRLLAAVLLCLSACAYHPPHGGHPDIKYWQRPRAMPVAFDIQVVGRLSGEPFAGARVMLLREDPPRSRSTTPPPSQPVRRSAIAGASGRLRLRGLAPGDYAVCAVHGELRGGIGLHVRAGQRVRITLRLAELAELDGCDLILRQAQHPDWKLE